MECCESYCLVGICPMPGYLIVLTPSEEADPPVWFAEDVLVARHADSFEKLLFRAAFEGFVLRPCPHRWSLQIRDDAPSLDEAMRAAASLGFVPAPGSDSLVGCVERPDRTACIAVYAGTTMTVSLAAASAPRPTSWRRR